MVCTILLGYYCNCSLFFYLVEQPSSELTLTSTLTSNCPVPTSSVKEEEDCSKNFVELASEIGTDKVTSHAYQHAYELYLPAVRHTSVKRIEIGLGCDINYGPGKSLDLWDRYFTQVNTSIFFIEYDHECAKKWEHPHKRVTVDTGDQANVTFLNVFLRIMVVSMILLLMMEGTRWYSGSILFRISSHLLGLVDYIFLKIYKRVT